MIEWIRMTPCHCPLCNDPEYRYCGCCGDRLADDVPDDRFTDMDLCWKCANDRIELGEEWIGFAEVKQ